MSPPRRAPCVASSEGYRQSNRLTELAQSIKHYFDNERRGVEARLKIGRALIEAKELCNHGQWLQWLKANFDWRERSAQRYMDLARTGWTIAQVQHVAAVTTDDAVADDDLCEGADDDPPRVRGRGIRRVLKDKRPANKSWTADGLVEIIAQHIATFCTNAGETMTALESCHEDLSTAKRNAHLKIIDMLAELLATHLNLRGDVESATLTFGPRRNRLTPTTGVWPNKRMIELDGPVIDDLAELATPDTPIVIAGEES